jgi:Ni,Fe-hydrogenase I cytochrome b subunit
MFDSLADRIKADERQEVKNSERIFRWVLMTVVSIVIFGGLYLGVKFLE